MLIPAFVQVSGWIQTAAGWVKSLDGETKGIVSTIAKWGGGIVVIGGALSKLGAIILPVITGFGSLAAAAGRAAISIGAFAISNPTIAGLTLMASGVAALAWQFGSLDTRMSNVANRARTANDSLRALQNGGELTYDTYRDSLTTNSRQRLESATPENRGRLVREAIENTSRRIQDVDRTNPTGVATAIEQALNNNQGIWFNEAGRRRTAIRQAMINAGVPEQEAERRLNEHWSSWGDSTLSRPSLGWDTIRNISSVLSLQSNRSHLALGLQTLQSMETAGAIPSPDRPAIARSFQPRSYGSGDQFYSDILQNVLGRGELEQRLLQQQMDNDQRLLEDVTRRIVTAIQQNGNNPPPR
jgi:hypothetical protein